ncbi:MAG: 2'-5' RNA ligase family protein [Planctomycetota bacterium]|nr:MAG: 2'-5' RNA ligase family protein [Planctomycetota bacterium]
MNPKTHQTAIVIIPPDPCWEPIQVIRREHDRQFRRWMPHITLIYPFRPRNLFDAVTVQLREACRLIKPFEIDLPCFHHFQHGQNHTLWLAPQPNNPLIQLQAALESAVPDCNDTSRHPDGFTPHLSVGQVRGRRNMDKLKQQLQNAWQPISLPVTEISLIWRNPPPDDIFHLDRTIPLG